MPIILVKTADNPVPDSPGKWRAGEVVTVVPDNHQFGSQEVPSAGKFYHIKVTDKTLEEVREYMQAWSHDPTVQQVSANGDDRVIEVTSAMVSASGANAFTQTGVEQLLTEINGTYISHTSTSFQFSVTATLEQRDEVIRQINDAVRGMQYRRRRWYINANGRSYLASQGGSIEVTASQLAPHLRDGLLD